MKKYLVPLLAVLLTSLPALAQDVDENSEGFKIGYWIGKNILWIIAGLILVIILFRSLRKKK